MERQEQVVEQFNEKKSELLENVKADDTKSKDTEFIPPTKEFDAHVDEQNRLDIPRFSAMLDKFNISDRAGAALATALMNI